MQDEQLWMGWNGAPVNGRKKMSREKKKNGGPLLSMKYWLVNMDPYNGLLYNPHEIG